MDIGWSFSKMRRDEMNVDPVLEEFFRGADLTENLVRESIQNSLDAKLETEKAVRVRFAFSSSANELPYEESTMYMHRLWPHLEAAAPADSPSEDEPMRFLVVEDFGTRGLCGDPTQYDDPKVSETKNDFFYFWRNYGRSSKRETQLGRWGVGKTVFAVSSRASCFFGLTVREDDKQRLLMGQSVLKTHSIGDERYPPYGFYAKLETDGFPIPISDHDRLGDFCSKFGLQRRTESGLSLVIPYYRSQELTRDNLERAVIQHYFYPILTRHLVVDIEGSGSLLDDSTILDRVGKVAWENAGINSSEMTKLVELAHWAAHVQTGEVFKLNQSDAYRLDDSLFPIGRLDEARSQFERGNRLAFRVPVSVERKSGEVQESYFEMFLQKDEKLARGQDRYIRHGITIPGVFGLAGKPVRGLLVVEDDALSTFLGDSENPSHTLWEERSPKIKGDYEHGVALLRFVKGGLRSLVVLLTRTSEGLDKELLKDIFYVDAVHLTGPDTGSQPSEATGLRSVQKEVKVQRGRSTLQVTPIRGGFRVSRRPNVSNSPKKVKLTVAYDVRRGNPFNKYDRRDFMMNKPPVQVDAKGAEITVREGQTLEFSIKKDDFSVTVKGFDRNRDVKVRTSQLE